MKLIAYTLSPDIPEIRPAGVLRDWMDQTPQSFAYRCLPLNIANSHGWEILCPCDFSAIWTGSPDQKSIIINCSAPDYDRPLSHFGSGVLTFHVNVLFRTEPGYNLYVTGPVNSPKDGIAPLSGIVETDWSPYSFTMNWKFTRANEAVHFKKGEPFCFIFPVKRDVIENMQPEFRRITDDPVTNQQYQEWSNAREKFIATLSDPASEAAKEKWQKAYYRGLLPNDQPGCPHHQIKLKVKNFDKSNK
ncbi:MAG: hypothetical protein EYC62_00020 [Alphaproteobacteria bacterium]|nr:MAG: hypothetical protein EYC62_00020 [Alphaproteobacteria bacterium]